MKPHPSAPSDMSETQKQLVSHITTRLNELFPDPVEARAMKANGTLDIILAGFITGKLVIVNRVPAASTVLVICNLKFEI